MSWDVILVKTKSNMEAMEDIDEENVVPFIEADVASLLKENFKKIDSSSDKWLDYECNTFAISFNLADDKQIMLHISILEEPEDSVNGVIDKLCDLFSCRAFDTTLGEFI